MTLRRIGLINISFAVFCWMLITWVSTAPGINPLERFCLDSPDKCPISIDEEALKIFCQINTFKCLQAMRDSIEDLSHDVQNKEIENDVDSIDDFYSRGLTKDKYKVNIWDVLGDASEKDYPVKYVELLTKLAAKQNQQRNKRFMTLSKSDGSQTQRDYPTKYTDLEIQLAKQKQKRRDEMTTPLQQAMFTKWLLNGNIPATSRKIPFHNAHILPRFTSRKDNKWDKANDRVPRKVSPTHGSSTLPSFGGNLNRGNKDYKTNKAVFAEAIDRASGKVPANHNSIKTSPPFGNKAKTNKARNDEDEDTAAKNSDKDTMNIMKLSDDNAKNSNSEEEINDSAKVTNDSSNKATKIWLYKIPSDENSIGVASDHPINFFELKERLAGLPKQVDMKSRNTKKKDDIESLKNDEKNTLDEKTIERREQAMDRIK
uniref:Uncharacterized protein n=1 Tax=Clytia hemisphaerica TaxID=252671 RepID=A0A7M5X5P4_9CNID